MELTQLLGIVVVVLLALAAFGVNASRVSLGWAGPGALGADRVGAVSKPDWLIRLHNPGAPLWWSSYLAWKWFRLCWTAHPIERVGKHSECSQFWRAEEDLLYAKRHPEMWEEAGLTAPPRVCLYGNTFTSSAGLVVMANPTTSGYTIKCLCGRHE